jgi:hypothetical protein
MTAKTLLKKLFAAHHYDPKNKVDANILLIKPTENYAKLAADYNLSDVSRRLVMSSFDS